jgi:uncharacterized protein YutD
MVTKKEATQTKSNKPERFKRVNILITEGQHDKVAQLDLSLSGLVRDLLDDRFSDSTITLALTPKTKEHYDYIVSNFGVSDSELEPYFSEALDQFLESKIKEIEGIRQRMRKKK